MHNLWLRFAGVVIAVGGPVLTLATFAGFSEPARWSLDLLSYPIDGFPTYDDRSMRFLSALSGGFLVAWGVMAWCLAVWVHTTNPEGARRVFVVSACSWFVFDSTGSIASGAWPNAVWNVFFLLLVIGPMWRPAR